MTQCSLHSNPFAILGVSVRDDRKRIMEMADEKSLILDHDVCAQARSVLTNPRKRLEAEISWLIGLSPTRVNDYLNRLSNDISSIKSDQSISDISKCNLLAASLEMLNGNNNDSEITDWIVELSYTSENINPEIIQTLLNEERQVSGFTQINSLDEIENQILERRRYYKDTIKSYLNKLPTMQLVEIVTNVADVTTENGEKHAPLLVDELIDSYEADTNNYLENESENIRVLLNKLRDVANHGDEVINTVTARINSLVREWDRVAQPIQLSMKARGLNHNLSSNLAYDIRSLGLEIFENHGNIEVANYFTKMLQEVFAEAPDVVEQLEEDFDAIENIFKGRKEAEKESDKWKKEIAFEEDIGLVFKDKLKISAVGIQWKNKAYALDNISRVRWGGISKSVNGIPTGTTYTIAFGNNKSESVIETRNSKLYQRFIDKLWLAVGVRLMTDMANNLKNGKKLQLGDALIDDQGVELTHHKLFKNRKVYYSWKEVSISSGQGYFFISSNTNKKIYSSMSYIETPNTHVLESLIRISFKNWTGRISSVLT